jgi:hypothetical protein
MQTPESRISYSFPPPTFDIDCMQPELWRASKDGRTLILSLRTCWKKWLPALSKWDLVMACARLGPMSIATALAPIRLNRVPDSNLWICLESGMELDTSNLGAAALVIEHLHSHTFASLQFFDRSGQGVLKLLATNGTDLATFHAFARQFGCKRQTLSQLSSELPPLDLSPPDPETLAAVRTQWLSLTRTLPEHTFPGQPTLARLAALKAVGSTRAWQISTKAALAAVGTLTLHQAPLGAAIRTTASFLPTGFYPLRHEACCCGTTFFSDTVQLTLHPHPHSTNSAEAWVTRFTQGTHDVRCIEFYLNTGHFCGGIGLRPEAEPRHHTLWNGILSQRPLD